MLLRLTLLLGLVLSLPLSEAVAAAELRLSPGAPGDLQRAIAGADPGDVLILGPGTYPGALIIETPVTLVSESGEAVIDGQGQGTVISIVAEDVTLRGLTVIGSGMNSEELDAGIKVLRPGHRAKIENNRVLGNLHGIDLHGGRDAHVIGNYIEGTLHPRLNDRGNGIYVWNSPGGVVENNVVRFGRDGIFSNASKDNVFRNNVFRDLRFAVHYMYTHRSEVVGNVSIGNRLGFAVMYSNWVTVRDNLSLGDRNHGVMLNFSNNTDVSGNYVRGGTEKCLFIYNAHKNLIYDNRFEGCDIGIHFTAGSERNAITGNAFVGNREQVRYVGTKTVEWSHDGKGNYWSDHPAFDLNGDGVADAVFRPNDLMDHILWSQPSAALLIGSPAVQLIRWSQSHFPATLPGGVLDSYPAMRPVEIQVPDAMAVLETEVRGRWIEEEFDDFDPEDLQSH